MELEQQIKEGEIFLYEVPEQQRTQELCVLCLNYFTREVVENKVMEINGTQVTYTMSHFPITDWIADWITEEGETLRKKLSKTFEVVATSHEKSFVNIIKEVQNNYLLLLLIPNELFTTEIIDYYLDNDFKNVAGIYVPTATKVNILNRDKFLNFEHYLKIAKNYVLFDEVHNLANSLKKRKTTLDEYIQIVDVNPELHKYLLNDIRKHMLKIL